MSNSNLWNYGGYASNEILQLFASRDVFPRVFLTAKITGGLQPIEPRLRKAFEEYGARAQNLSRRWKIWNMRHPAGGRQSHAQACLLSTVFSNDARYQYDFTWPDNVIG